jgi:hypothetical protein
VPEGCDALILVTVEELAVNDLREAFHQWVRTLRFPVIGGRLGDPLPHVPAALDHADPLPCEDGHVERARILWGDVEEDVFKSLQKRANMLTRAIEAQLAKDLVEERKNQERLFSERRTEVEKQLERQLKDLEKEMDQLLDEIEQEDLFRDTELFRGLDQSTISIQAERERRQEHHKEMLEFLQAEEKRIVEGLLPKRHQLRGDVQVFPVTVEIRFPGSSANGGNRS